MLRKIRQEQAKHRTQVFAKTDNAIWNLTDIYFNFYLPSNFKTLRIFAVGDYTTSPAILYIRSSYNGAGRTLLITANIYAFGWNFYELSVDLSSLPTNQLYQVQISVGNTAQIADFAAWLEN